MYFSWFFLVVLLSRECLGKRRNARNQEEDFKHKIFFDQHFNHQRRQTDRLSIPYVRETQLYSKASKEHIQVLGRKIDGKGKHGSRYAHLIIETDTFGRIRIKGAYTKYYICMNKRGKVVGKLNGRRRKRCVFKENYRDNGYTEFVFTANSSWYLSIAKNGLPKRGMKTGPNMKSVQFIERPLVNMSVRSRFLKKLRRRKQDLKNTMKSLLDLKKFLYQRSEGTSLRQRNGKPDLMEELSERTILRPLKSRFLRKMIRNLRRQEQRKQRT